MALYTEKNKGETKAEADIIFRREAMNKKELKQKVKDDFNAKKELLSELSKSQKKELLREEKAERKEAIRTLSKEEKKAAKRYDKYYRHIFEKICI